MILDKLSDDILNALKICSDIANNEQIKIFLIGGVVRDLLIDKQTLDIDVCLESDAIEFANILKKENKIEILQIQPDLHTVKVQFSNDVILDLASTRKEAYPKASYLPEITDFYCPLSEDIKRRDFTINSMMIDILTNELIDPFNGKNDLENKIIRIQKRR